MNNKRSTRRERRRKSRRHRSQQPEPPTSTARPDRASDPIVYWMHALACMGDERLDEAVTALHRFLDLVHTPTERRMAYFNLSACYLALEQYDDALTALDEVEQLDKVEPYTPDDPEVVQGRAVVYACAGRIEEAIAAFEQFARHWPGQARQRETREILRQLGRIQRGKSPPGDYVVGHLQEQIPHNVDLGDWDIVERKARRMIAANPDRSEGHFALGVAYVEQGCYAEGLDAFLKSHGIIPDHEPTMFNVGHAYLKMDEPEQAIPWLERALCQEPKQLAAMHQLGVACERLGRRDEAVAWWRRALKIDPDHYMTQQRLHEVGQGPEPIEPPLLPTMQQVHTMTPIVKARMKRLTVHRTDAVTLTYDGQVGFVLEDAENRRNGSVYAGGPFHVARIADEDLLDLMGMVKMLLRMANGANTRDVAVLVYYANRPIFNYQAQFSRGEQVFFDADGRFVVTEMPRLFKLRMDSDLASPYGDPMQGTLIYLNQHPRPGVLVNTMGLASQ